MELRPEHFEAKHRELEGTVRRQNCINININKTAKKSCEGDIQFMSLLPCGFNT